MYEEVERKRFDATLFEKMDSSRDNSAFNRMFWFDLDKAPDHYPTLGLATFSDASVQLANSSNIVKSAIEHNEFVKIKNIDKVNRYIPRIFAEANLNEVVSINDLQKRSLPFCT